MKIWEFDYEPEFSSGLIFYLSMVFIKETKQENKNPPAIFLTFSESWHGTCSYNYQDHKSGECKERWKKHEV